MTFPKFPKSETDFKGLQWYPWFQMEEWRHKLIEKLEERMMMLTEALEIEPKFEYQQCYKGKITFLKELLEALK